MKSRGLIGIGFALLAAAILLVSAASSTQAAEAPDPGVARGAALYDKWYAVLGTAAPQGNMPIWARQNTNTRSGEDTWRCVSCHGWDYQGKDGAYRQGSSHFTGFPNVYLEVQKLSIDEIIGHLKGSKDPAHNFSPYIDDANLKALATFLKTALIDDNQYIDPQSLKVLGGSLANGKKVYDRDCAACHGADGQKLIFRLFEGSNASLGALAAVDPWRFLHKTRFGTPGTQMVIGYDLAWTAQDGRDALLYAQTMPGGNQREHQSAVIGEGQVTAVPLRGGPPTSILGGMGTALLAMFTGLGFNILVAAFLIGVLLLVVWVIRSRK